MKPDKIILDFDDTIFNDNRFMSDIFVVFNRFGVDKKDFDITYEQVKKGGWNPLTQAKLLFKKMPKNFIDEIGRTFASSRNYIFEDATAFLEKNKTSKNILSFGDKRTQLEKINNSDVAKHFDSVVVTADHLKRDFFAKISSRKSKIFFVDDKPKVINTIKASFPGIFCVLMARTFDPESGHKILADMTIKTFDDLSLLLQ